MPKKMKLEDVKIESFVTTLPKETEDRVKGGNKWASCPSCPDFCPIGDATQIEGCSGTQSSLVMCGPF